jgi:stearoyl-CoA desaturase (delta-9 desaturase)
MEESIKKTSLKLIISYLSVILAIYLLIGEYGVFGEVFKENTFWKFLIYGIVMTHITITSMSLSFHRYHTHKGVILNPILDTLMQLNLWLVGGMSKLDWVSVHIYHHAFSDKPEDPHSPVQKGILHILFLGVFDYSKAKESEPVLRIRKTIRRNKFEQFIADHTLLGIVCLTLFNLLIFGPLYGSIISLINFSISPIFAVGGVNGFAHWFGYKNHNYHDNSRNLGFVLPLNFLICGELDHNNHHAHPTSCSFRHRWFEFDWGYFYIKLFAKVGLAEIKHAYTPKSLKRELSVKVVQILEMDARFRSRLEELANELNTNYQDLLQNIKDYIEGKRTRVSDDVKLLISEAKRTFYINYRLNLNYN